MKIIVLSIFLLFCITSVYASAQDFKIINADELKQMIDAKKQMMLVDARTEQEYWQGHIPNAVNIPPEKLKVINTILPKDKKSMIVFYCRGTG